MRFNRFFALLMVLVMALALAACGGDTGADKPTEPSVAADPTEQVTEAPTEEATDAPTGIVYTVTVTDEGGNPIAGAMVQMCEGTNCIPSSTNENGVATFPVTAEADYEVKFMVMPAGYEYTTEEQVFTFDGDAKEMTIVLKAVA